MRRLAGALALAADIDATSRADSVTLYPDAAVTTRTAQKPEDWPQAWDVIGAALEKVGLDLRAARTTVADIDARIKIWRRPARRPRSVGRRRISPSMSRLSPGRENSPGPELPRRWRALDPRL